MGMMEQLLPGLWRWTAPHPDWKPSETGSPGDWDREVGCLRYEPAEPDAPLVLIEPLVPPVGTPEADELWKELDTATGRGQPVAIVLGNNFHHRSAPALMERYGKQPGATVWAPEKAQAHLEKVGCPVSNYYKDGQTLPGGLQAHEIEGLCPGEVVLYQPHLLALIVADALLGDAEGGLRVPPASWAADKDLYARAFLPSLRRLLDLPFERVILSHGLPVLQDARKALALALEG